MVNCFKKNGSVLDLLMFAFLSVSFMIAPPVFAQPTDLCLRATVKETEDGPLAQVKRFTINIHLASEDGSHFTIWGKVKIPNEPFYVGGTGILEGNNLTMNLTTSQKHTEGWRDSGIMQTKFNISTGLGSFYEIGHDFDPVNRVFDQRYTAGILRLCQ